MSELQLGLLGIGVLVVLGVLAYNKLQEARLKRQAEEVFGSKHADVLLAGKSGNTASQRPAGSTERIEPTLSAAPAETVTLGGALNPCIDFIVTLETDKVAAGEAISTGVGGKGATTAEGDRRGRYNT